MDLSHPLPESCPRWKGLMGLRDSCGVRCWYRLAARFHSINSLPTCVPRVLPVPGATRAMRTQLSEDPGPVLGVPLSSKWVGLDWLPSLGGVTHQVENSSLSGTTKHLG